MNAKVVVRLAKVEVDRGEFVKGLQLLAKHFRRPRVERAPRKRNPEKRWDVTIRFDADRLVVQRDDVEVSAAAAGEWQGTARVPLSFAHTVAGHAPQGTRLPIWVEPGRLHLPGVSVPCFWMPVSLDSVAIPPDASLVETLRLGMASSKEALAQTGVLKQVQVARRRRASLERQAATVLAPLGVTAQDVELLVEASLHASSELRIDK